MCEWQYELHKDGQVIALESFDPDVLIFDGIHLCNGRDAKAIVRGEDEKGQQRVIEEAYSFEGGWCRIQTTEAGQPTRNWLVCTDGSLPDCVFSTDGERIGKVYRVDDAGTFTAETGFKSSRERITGEVTVLGIAFIARKALVQDQRGVRYVIDSRDLPAPPPEPTTHELPAGKALDVEIDRLINGYAKYVESSSGLWWGYRSDDDPHPEVVPDYSTDLNAAWHYLTQTGCSVTILTVVSNTGDMRCLVTLDNSVRKWKGFAPINEPALACSRTLLAYYQAQKG